MAFPTKSLIAEKIPSTISLNHSHLLYKTTNAATNAAIAITTIITGFAAITAFTAAIAGFNILHTFIMLDIAPATLLIINSAGAKAATTARIITIVSFCPSDKFLNQSVKFFTALVTFSMAGFNADNAVPAKSLPASFRLFSVVFASSHGSNVAS